MKYLIKLDGLQAEDHEQGITDTAQCPAPEVLHLAMPAAAVALPEESMTEGALTNTLQAVFGFEAFRGLQLPVIQSVLRGTSTLAVLPTGTSLSPANTPLCMHDVVIS